MIACFAVFYTMKCPKSFYASLSTTSPSLINLQTTPSISKSNYSPLSSERGWGEALFALHHFTFNYPQRHAHNCFISQLRWYCAIIPMDEFRNINVLTTQLGTSCAFDSPGLARNEPTLGKRSQGDSTP